MKREKVKRGAKAGRKQILYVLIKFWATTLKPILFVCLPVTFLSILNITTLVHTTLGPINFFF